MSQVSKRLRVLLLIIGLICFSKPVVAKDTIPVSDPLPLTEAATEPVFSVFPANLFNNGTGITLSLPFMLNREGKAYICLNDCASSFKCNATWGQPGTLVLDAVGLSINMYLNSLKYTVNGLDKVMLCAPLQDPQGRIWLPLRTVAEELGYIVKYNSQKAEMSLMTADYWQGLPKSTPLPAMQDADLSLLPKWGTVSTSPLAACFENSLFLEGYYTLLINSPAPRTNNVLLASQAVNDTILQPGEVFSFNKVVGVRNTAKGYQSAPIFVGKKVVPGVGGGICQASSTIYNAALNTGLQVLERHPHSLPVAYVPSAHDATVNWNGADLKIKNSKDYPLKITCMIIKNYVIAVFTRVKS